jgi:murein DD-endopeptidase MepM/ murein hydrolase activator NlpD
LARTTELENSVRKALTEVFTEVSDALISAPIEQAPGTADETALPKPSADDVSDSTEQPPTSEIPSNSAEAGAAIPAAVRAALAKLRRDLPPKQANALAALFRILSDRAVEAQSPRAAMLARPDFRMPFTCGETWRLQTYAGHNPVTKIDMFRVGGATSGSVVRASAAGRVHELFSPGGVEINHGNRWFTVYLHMTNIAVRPGQRVALGQPIGRVGAVDTHVAHLHYEQLYDRDGNGDADNADIVASIIQGKLYNLKPGGPFPVVKSTNCGTSVPGWSSWQDLAGTLSSGPAAIARGTNKLDVFATAGNRVLWQRSWTGSAWTDWRNLRKQLQASPAVAAWNDNRLDLFGLGADRAIWHTYSNNGGASYAAWESLGGTIVGAPAAVAWGSGRIDLFARGVDNALVHKWWDGERWSDWENLGGTLNSGPAVASWGVGRLDVFVRGSDNGLYHRWFTAGRWSQWEDLGGKLTSDPAAVSRAKGSIDVVARGTDNSLWHRGYASRGGWRDWIDLGGSLTSSPAIASWGGNRLDAFGRGTDNSLWHIWTVATNQRISQNLESVDAI